MPYTITAETPEGVVTFRSGTPNGALETARELIELGLPGVSIRDTDGHQYTPTDFERRHARRDNR
jgi:hypothetical protein